MPGKIGQIICTGNVSDRETYDYLRTIAPDVHVVRGEFDEVGQDAAYWIHIFHSAPGWRAEDQPWRRPAVRADTQNPHFPLSLTVQHQSIRIGVVHGQQIVPAGDADMLAALARQMDVDVLVSGGTHRYVLTDADSTSHVHFIA